MEGDRGFYERKAGVEKVKKEYAAEEGISQNCAHEDQ